MRKSCLFIVVCGAAILAMAAGGIVISSHVLASSPAAKDPWPQSQLIAPGTLAEEIQAKGKSPRIVCVGFPVLYQAAHIPGAVLAGPAREPAGLAKLARWARHVPKDSRVAIYCGCCPFNVCPNIRPAYEALRKAGFTNVQVVDIPNSFLKDWMDKGYPVDKSNK